MRSGSPDCVGAVLSSWARCRSCRHLPSILSVLSLCCICSAACSNDPSEPEPIPIVQLLEGEATLGVGDSVLLSLLPVLPPGYVPPVTWSSSNPAVASVDSPMNSMCWVRGMSPGQAVILVSGEGKSDSARVVVSPPGEPSPTLRGPPPPGNGAPN